jgi:hypothetical protein
LDWAKVIEAGENCIMIFIIFPLQKILSGKEDWMGGVRYIRNKHKSLVRKPDAKELLEI